jgi:hypothetical protein
VTRDSSKADSFELELPNFESKLYNMPRRTRLPTMKKRGKQGHKIIHRKYSNCMKFLTPFSSRQRFMLLSVTVL